MNIEVKGTLKVIFTEEKINDRLSKKNIVVTVDSDTQYPQDIIIEAVNQKIELLDNFQMGDIVKVKCDLRGRENKGKYYNQLSLYQISK